SVSTKWSSASPSSWRDGEASMAGLAAEARVIVERPVEEGRVELGPRAYPIVIGAGLLGDVVARLAPARLRGRRGAVASERVGGLYRHALESALRSAGFEPTVIEIPDGEEHKNLAWLAVIYDRLLGAGLERRSPIVGLGGGVVTDLAGFAAGTVLRGVPCVLVPTTLLGQVDAAIGGKTAPNPARGENPIGLVPPPRLGVSGLLPPPHP